MDTIITADRITSMELRAEAERALAAGQEVKYQRCGSVETLVLEDGRGAQSTNGDALWGDWAYDAQTLHLDERDDHGRQLVAGLDGQQRVSVREVTEVTTYQVASRGSITLCGPCGALPRPLGYVLASVSRGKHRGWCERCESVGVEIQTAG